MYSALEYIWTVLIAKGHGQIMIPVEILEVLTRCPF